MSSTYSKSVMLEEWPKLIPFILPDFLGFFQQYSKSINYHKEEKRKIRGNSGKTSLIPLLCLKKGKVEPFIRMGKEV